MEGVIGVRSTISGMLDGAAPTEAANPIRVYLVDDHDVVRRGLRDVLAPHPDIAVVGESGSALQAMRRIPALRPDVAIVDMQLPDGSGVEVCRAVQSARLATRTLILTSFNDDDALYAAIMAGACGYFLKEVKGLELVEAVRRVALGQSLLDPAVTAQVLDRLRRSTQIVDGVPGLTEQEGKILSLIADGLSNREIAQEMVLAEKTVKNYVSSILTKLHLERRTQATVFEVERRQRQS
jgi:two-component system, NarL family, response regulator DevR